MRPRSVLRGEPPPGRGQVHDGAWAYDDFLSARLRHRRLDLRSRFAKQSICTIDNIKNIACKSYSRE